MMQNRNRFRSILGRFKSNRSLKYYFSIPLSLRYLIFVKLFYTRHYVTIPGFAVRNNTVEKSCQKMERLINKYP